MEKTTSNDAAVPLLGDDWFDPLEAGVRQRIRSFIEAMLTRIIHGAPEQATRCGCDTNFGHAGPRRGTRGGRGRVG